MQENRKMLPWILFAVLWVATGINIHAQGNYKQVKPYKLQASGRQLTIKSNAPIHHIMLWTIDGNRVVEQKNINNNSFTIDIPVYRKAFYLMIELTNGKIFTEKIGIF